MRSDNSKNRDAKLPPHVHAARRVDIGSLQDCSDLVAKLLTTLRWDTQSMRPTLDAGSTTMRLDSVVENYDARRGSGLGRT